jgi:CubicO group peptidase (beta-lactamase class C family)
MQKFAIMMLPTILLATGCATVKTPAIDAIMSDYAGHDRPGASVLVFRDGQIAFVRSYGMADLENGAAATPDTNYRLASVTKQFTAAAVLRLVEMERLSLDDQLRMHFPSLPAEVDAVTVEQLLTHTSGLMDYEDVMAPDSPTVYDRDVLRLLETQRSTYFAPGTGYRYSNSGYALLALLVEKISGQTFARFLEREVFGPLGMRDTVAHQEGLTVVARRAYGYSRAGSSWRRTDQSNTSAVLGDGGVYSSVADLARWLAALDRGAFAEASVPRVATSDPRIRYGYGWRVSEHGGKRIVMHTGETIGFRNALVRFPDQRLGVVVLTNRNEGEPLELALRIADVLGGE